MSPQQDGTEGTSLSPPGGSRWPWRQAGCGAAALGAGTWDRPRAVQQVASSCPIPSCGEGELAARLPGRSLPCAGRSRVVPVSLGRAGGVTPGTFPRRSCPHSALLSPLTGLRGTAASPARGHSALSLGTERGAMARHSARGLVWVPSRARARPAAGSAAASGGGQCLCGVQGDAACRPLSRVGAALRGAAFCTGLVGKGGSESGGQGQQAGAQLSAEVRGLCPGCPGKTSPPPVPGCIFALPRPSASPCSRPGSCCRQRGQEAARGGCGFCACMTWRLRGQQPASGRELAAEHRPAVTGHPWGWIGTWCPGCTVQWGAAWPWAGMDPAPPLLGAGGSGSSLSPAPRPFRVPPAEGAAAALPIVVLRVPAPSLWVPCVTAAPRAVGWVRGAPVGRGRSGSVPHGAAALGAPHGPWHGQGHGSSSGPRHPC